VLVRVRCRERVRLELVDVREIERRQRRDDRIPQGAKARRALRRLHSTSVAA